MDIHHVLISVFLVSLHKENNLRLIFGKVYYFRLNLQQSEISVGIDILNNHLLKKLIVSNGSGINIKWH